MHHRKRLAQLLFSTLLVSSTAVFAQETPPPAEPASPAPAASAAAPAAAEAAPAASEGAPAAGEGVAPTEEPIAARTAASDKVAERGRFGLAARWRWVTVPGWFLGLFAQKNVPLSTFNCWALEGFWRKHDRDDRNRTWEIVVSVGYQNMSPPDGYWLGRGKSPSQDADLVQAKGLGLVTMDAAYVLRQYFSPYFGIHYGAGLGLGVVRGKILRTSAQYDPATGQYTVHDPGTNAVICDSSGKCNETMLAQTQTGPDNGPFEAHRYQESSVPSAIPIINLLFGLDFPIPDAQGLEFRIEGGFYDAFFVGASAGYGF